MSKNTLDIIGSKKTRKCLDSKLFTTKFRLILPEQIFQLKKSEEKLMLQI